ncbi:hypothetical protein ATCC90586_008633 [Pythium insidiosum]|nr:hypothetical protein ATCC90586_008633 [Pythium insidiosum]
MSPMSNPNEILNDNNYFLWEFNARMALARKDLLGHLDVKPEDAVNAPAVWKAADMKALAVLSKMLSPTYQMMHVNILEAKEMLRREYEMIQKREATEQAFKAMVNGGPRGGRCGRRSKFQGRQGGGNSGDKKAFKGRCYELVTIPRAGKMYACTLRYRDMDVAMAAADVGPDASLYELVHARLGHVSNAKMKMTARVCDGIPALAPDDDVCGGCAQGKMTTSPFAHHSGSEIKTSRPFEIVHTDIMGPIKPKSKGGAFDNGGEYVSKRFGKFCASKGIVRQTSAPYAPQQNGLAERMNRTLTEMARSMLYYMQVDRVWWAEAFRTASYIINRIPNTAQTAFLDGDLKETVYMHPPEGVKVTDDLVCVLRRSIYGLKQAAAVWFRKIRGVFKSLGFKQCRADPWLFVRRDRGDDDDASAVYVVLYEDDLLVGCESEEQAKFVCDGLSAHFKLKSLGDARFVLGMEVQYDRERGEMMVLQFQLINKLLTRFGQESAHAVRNPKP